MPKGSHPAGARVAIAYVDASGEHAVGTPARPSGDAVRVVATVVEDDPATRGGLASLLERLARGEASTLLVERLADVAPSLHELLALLDWLEAAGASLIARDVEFDTCSRAGQRTVALLRELGHAERHPPPGRPMRGRPGLAAQAPELSERIAAMRERGLSLRAIADTLSEDGVPTQRGGVRWRASSVQAALGYRRPRPPLPGAPPPPAGPPPPGSPPPPGKPAPHGKPGPAQAPGRAGARGPAGGRHQRGARP